MQNGVVITYMKAIEARDAKELIAKSNSYVKIKLHEPENEIFLLFTFSVHLTAL